VRWVAEFCPTEKYILKADEDIFVLVPNLIRVLQKQTVCAYMALEVGAEKYGESA